jgi:hypothetical protein
VIVHRADSQTLGKTWVTKLRGVLPRQQYEMSIQAFVGSKCVASEKISAVRKDVTGSSSNPFISFEFTACAFLPEKLTPLRCVWFSFSRRNSWSLWRTLRAEAEAPQQAEGGKEEAQEDGRTFASQPPFTSSYVVRSKARSPSLTEYYCLSSLLRSFVSGQHRAPSRSLLRYLEIEMISLRLQTRARC